MKLVVGLGNPGHEYQKTRHNTGFFVLDHYLEQKNPLWKEKFQGLYYSTTVGKENVIFLKPQTYMNNSGESVVKFAHFYKIAPQDILIICDDLDQALGKFRLRSHGSSGGHNGLKSIEESLQSQEYCRLRIGITSETRENIPTIPYVLGNFTKEEQEKLDQLQKQLNQVLDDYFKLSFAELMNQYNHRK